MSGTIFNSLYVLTKLILMKPLEGRYCFLPHFIELSNRYLQMFSRVDLNNISKFKNSFLIDKKMFSFYNLFFLLVMNDTVFPIFFDPQYTSDLFLYFFFLKTGKVYTYIFPTTLIHYPYSYMSDIFRQDWELEGAWSKWGRVRETHRWRRGKQGHIPVWVCGGDDFFQIGCLNLKS